MPERQIHGLTNEDRIKKEFNLKTYLEKQNYTANYDAQTNKGIPVSIKTMKFKTDVELGDYWRNADAKQDFYMIVSFWDNPNHTIVEEYHLLIPVDVWRTFFNRSMDDRIRSIIKDASNDRSYDKTWRAQTKQLKEDYGTSVIRLRPKRDHKKQKRMQCAISYKDFLALHQLYKTEDIRNHK